MNAQVKPHADNGRTVSWWKAGECRVKGRKHPVKGYALMSGGKGLLGFIETTGPNPRVEELLHQYTEPGSLRTARQLMRELLNAEDYRSPIYDAIVRVYYTEDVT